MSYDVTSRERAFDSITDDITARDQKPHNDPSHEEVSIKA